MTPRHIGGLDVSTARIGYAAPNGSLHSITTPHGAQDPYRRLVDLWRGLHMTIRRNPPLPDLIAVEGYSLAMMTVTKSTTTGTHRAPTGVLSKIRLGEVGGLMRVALYELDITHVEIPPSSLKRFATGRGNADKEQMVAAAIRLGARGSANHDEADAFHLRRMARAAHGLATTALLDYEADAIANLTW